MRTSDDLKMVEIFDSQISTGGNTGLAKVAVQCSADTFVVNQSLVLRINICGKNRHLRQARNRWWQFLETPCIDNNYERNYTYKSNSFAF